MGLRILYKEMMKIWYGVLSDVLCLKMAEKCLAWNFLLNLEMLIIRDELKFWNKVLKASINNDHLY